MDFSTTLTKVKPIPFPEEGAQAISAVDNVRDRKPTQTEVSETPPIPSANSLPDSILSSWTRIARAGMSVGMYDDLVRIAARPPGWGGPSSLGLRPASLRNFLEFWSSVRDAASEPELTLAPDGTLHAEWFKSARQHLDVRFLEQRVIFGLFANNSILEGAEHRDMVAQVLKAHRAKPLSWSAR
jgi:hypothetical protein